MKLALVISGGVDRSGEQRVIPALLALIKGLSRAHEVHVYALHQEPRPGEWLLRDARIHDIGTDHTGWCVLRAITAIRREHRIAPFDVIQSIWSGTPGVVAMAAARLLGVPGAVHVTGGEVASIPDIAYGGRRNWQGRAREALVLRAATVVSASSRPIVESLAELGVAAERVALGVDRDVWPVRAPLRRVLPGAARLIHIGSLNRVKDQTLLLQAFARLVAAGRDAHLDIVGQDTLHGAVQRLATGMGLDHRLTFHGFLPQRELRLLIETAHVLVMSSRHEAGPYAMLEAAVVGVPTVGTAVGHIAEWAPDAALAVPVGDAAGLAALVDSMLGDETLRLRIAAAAQRRALDDDAGHTVRGFERIYANLLRERRS